MLLSYTNKTVYLASKSVDFRMSIDGLSSIIQREAKDLHVHDGSIYVFYNHAKDKIKCLFWDRNGFVLYYKRLDKCKFKIKDMRENIENITPEELEILLSGLHAQPSARLIEHKKG